MKTTTISKEFDAADLPAWARKHQGIVLMCKTDLAFRVDVSNARTKQMQRFLINEAKRRALGE